MRVCCEFEVESGIVDADERIRTLLLECLLEGAEQSVEPGQVTHDLNKPVDLKIVEGCIEPQTCLKHLRTTHAKEISCGVVCLQACD